MEINDYRDLEIWKLGMEIAAQCYQVTKGFPKEELFWMTSQIRRAAASIPANIAEGHGRDHTKEFLNHLSIANGSLKELETHLMLATKVGLMTNVLLDPLLQLTQREGQMITRMRQALRRKLAK